MRATSETEGIEGYLRRGADQDLLRLLTCGSVDDGKSTLIGRLLYDSQLIHEDQLEKLKRDSKVHGTTDSDFDPALLTDGLKAEREQGITIDVAYRYFSTPKRKFIIADTPGHEQYTRNMATGASTCDLAIILVDARKGISTQTRRHSFIVSLLGIQHVVVAINKMDLVDYSESVFERIKSDYIGFAAKLEVPDVHFVPLSALRGDNVVHQSEPMSWYGGSSLIHLLESIVIASDRNLIDFRFPVQYVNRPDSAFRGYAGTVVSGVVRPGDEVMVLPSRKATRVDQVMAYPGELTEAYPPMAVTLTLRDEVDVARGDVLVHRANLPRVTKRLEVMVVWMHEDAMIPGKTYLVKRATRTVGAQLTQLRYRVDVETMHRQAADTLGLNDIGRCVLELNELLAMDGYQRNRTMGSLIIIDRISNATVAAAMVLDRPDEPHRPDHWETDPASVQLSSTVSRVSEAERCERLQQTPYTLLLTGLTRAGKTTLAYALERRLFDQGQLAMVLDGQNLRFGVNRDLGFSDEERSEALRRAAETAKTINQAGLICICAFVAPQAAVRRRMAEVIGHQRWVTVYLNAPEDVRLSRDEQGLYQKAKRGEIGAFPGVSADYEAPTDPELSLDTSQADVATCIDRICAYLRERALL